MEYENPRKNTHLLHSKFTKNFCHQELFFFCHTKQIIPVVFWGDQIMRDNKNMQRTMICQTHQQPTSTNNMVVFFISDFDTLTLLADGTEPKIPSSHQPSPYGPMIYRLSVLSEFYLFLGFWRAFRTTRCLPD